MRIGFLLFDQVTQLDLTGPAQVLARLPGAEIILAAKTRDPVATDCGFSILPTHAFDEAGPLDVICAPGGYGVAAAMGDDETRAFVASAAEGARYVTSVCTGGFILGAAGLLKGKRATSHWAYLDLLSLLGAAPISQRVVRDGALITGAGVTAGIDFALVLAAEIAGEDTARAIQHGLEYDPAPPFAGAPPHAVRRKLDAAFEARRAVMRRACEAEVAAER